MTMIELDAEYLAALADTSPRRRRQLQSVGVPQHALDLASPVFARIRPVGASLFEPNPDSNLGAWIIPVRVEHPDTPESPDPEAAIVDGEIVDLVAFDLQLAARWVLRTGNAEWLGSCPPQYLEPPPVALHRSPIDWLRADCRGLVCLARAPLDVYRFLTRFAALDVADAGHAEELGKLLERPPTHPEILVGGRIRHAG
jgi:hypothetical protein